MPVLPLHSVDAHASVVIKWGLPYTTNLPIFKSLFFLSLSCYETWVMIERILSQAQATEIGFLRGVYGVTNCVAVIIRKSLKC